MTQQLEHWQLLRGPTTWQLTTVCVLSSGNPPTPLLASSAPKHACGAHAYIHTYIHTYIKRVLKIRRLCLAEVKSRLSVTRSQEAKEREQWGKQANENQVASR